MIRKAFGIFIVCFFCMALVGTFLNPSVYRSNATGGNKIVMLLFPPTFFILIGSLLLISGQRFLNRRRKAVESILDMLRKEDKINTKELADKIKIKEEELIKFFNYGKRKNIFPNNMAIEKGSFINT